MRGAAGEAASDELRGLYERFYALEDKFEKASLAREKKLEAEMQVITDLLAKIEKDLAGSRAGLSEPVKALHSKASELHAMTESGGFDSKIKSLASELKQVDKHIETIEARVEEKPLVAEKHVVSLQEQVAQARESFEQAKGAPVNPGVVVEAREKVEEMKAPAIVPVAVEHKEAIAETREKLDVLKQKLAESGDKLAGKHVEKIEEQQDRLTRLEKSLAKASEQPRPPLVVVEASKQVQQVAKAAEAAPVVETPLEGRVMQFLFSAPAGARIPARDVSDKLGAPVDDVNAALQRLAKKNPGYLQLENTGLLTKLTGKELTIVKQNK